MTQIIKKYTINKRLIVVKSFQSINKEFKKTNQENQITSSNLYCGQIIED